MKMPRTLNVTCGIYSTRYTVTAHRDGSISLRSPYIKWVGNSGNLAFRNSRFAAGHLATEIKQAFRDQTTLLAGYNAATLQEDTPDIGVEWRRKYAQRFNSIVGKGKQSAEREEYARRAAATAADAHIRNLGAITL